MSGMGLVSVIRQVSGKAWPTRAPDPLPERDEWISDQVANYVQAPYHLGDPTRPSLPSAHQKCTACGVSWVGLEPCWSCHPTASSDFPTFRLSDFPTFPSSPGPTCRGFLLPTEGTRP